jgi:hypothetical protein
MTGTDCDLFTHKSVPVIFESPCIFISFQRQKCIVTSKLKSKKLSPITTFIKSLSLVPILGSCVTCNKILSFYAELLAPCPTLNWRITSCWLSVTVYPVYLLPCFSGGHLLQPQAEDMPLHDYKRSTCYVTLSV